MKKFMTYIAVFIIITACMLMFFIRNFPAEMAELSLDGSVNPSQIDIAMLDNSIYDYLNIYDIFVRSENANVYSGNINILLRKSDIKAGLMTYKDDEIIMGENYMQENFNYSLLGEKYESQFGEYNVNCIIKNSDKTYYRNISILDDINIKGQRLYISLITDKKIPIKYNQVINALRYYNIGVAKSLYYSDVINCFKKLLIVLIIAEFLFFFIKLLNYCKKSLVALSESRKTSQYDLTIKEFIFKTNNISSIFKLIVQVVILILLGIALMVLTVFIIKIYTSYLIDYTSLKSILNAVTNFISMLKYYITNGLTNIAVALISCIVIYLISFIMIIIIELRKYISKFMNKEKSALN